MSFFFAVCRHCREQDPNAIQTQRLYRIQILNNKQRLLWLRETQARGFLFLSSLSPISWVVMSTRRAHYWQEMGRRKRLRYHGSSSPYYCFSCSPNPWPWMLSIPSCQRYAPLFYLGGRLINFGNIEAYTWYWDHPWQREKSGILCRSHGALIDPLLNVLLTHNYDK